MYPILYEATETRFNNMGICTLSDCTKCTVFETRNGNYELEATYPTRGAFVDEIKARRIIYAIPSPYRKPQPFRIYRVEKVLKGTITIRARHVIYDAEGIPVDALSIRGTPAEALNALITNSMITNPFTVWTDKVTTARTFKSDVPRSFKHSLYGSEGSIVDTYGRGDYEFDHWNVKLYTNRGKDDGVTIVQGKQITGMNAHVDTSNMITGVIPYWKSLDGEESVYGDLTRASGEFSFEYIEAHDFTDKFEEKPTVEQLNQEAREYVSDTTRTTPNISISVKLVDLAKYNKELVSALEKVDLCDTVTVYSEEFKIAQTSRVLSIETNVLDETYNEITIGSLKSTAASVIAEASNLSAATANTVSQDNSSLINGVTELTTGQYYVTPEMYGAKGDGSTDDSDAFTRMFSDAVANKKAVRFKTATYYFTRQVNIPGKISVIGNSAILRFAAGVNGLMMTAAGAESTFDNFVVSSDNGTPDPTGLNFLEGTAKLGTIGLSVSGAHSKITTVSVNNFHTGIFYDERLISGNQTGLIVRNCHVRYTCCGLRVGYKDKNNKTTDTTISDCTLCGTVVALYLCSGVGDLINNIHTWGHPQYGIYSLDTSVTNINNVYIEACAEGGYAAHIHTLKGLSISNFVYTPGNYSSSKPQTYNVFHFSGPNRGRYHVNLDNISIRGDATKEAVLISGAYRGVFNIGNIFATEAENQASGGGGYVITKETINSMRTFYQNNGLQPVSDYNSRINGRTFLTGAQNLYLATSDADGVVTVDCSSMQSGHPVTIEVAVTTRTNNDVVAVGKYIIGAIKKGSGAVEAPIIETIVNNRFVALTVAQNADDTKKLDITVTQGQVSGAATMAQITVQPLYAYS